jgi:hypothetical protein
MSILHKKKNSTLPPIPLPFVLTSALKEQLIPLGDAAFSNRPFQFFKLGRPLDRPAPQEVLTLNEIAPFYCFGFIRRHGRGGSIPIILITSSGSHGISAQ